MPNPTTLHAPPTRALQAWTRFWQQYRGTLPSKVDKVNTHFIPAIRALSKTKR